LISQPNILQLWKYLWFKPLRVIHERCLSLHSSLLNV
jgi:hypothetical protein